MKKGLVLASLFAMLMVLAAAPVFAGGYVYPGCAPKCKPAPAPVNLQLVMPPAPVKKCVPEPCCKDKKVTCYKVGLEPVTVTDTIRTAIPVQKVIEYTCWVPVKEKVKVTDYEMGCAVVPTMGSELIARPDACKPYKSLTCSKPVKGSKVVEDWRPYTYWKWVKCLKPVKCKRVCTVWQYGTEEVKTTYHKKVKQEVPCPPCAPNPCKK
jgi:hypothetical protein